MRKDALQQDLFTPDEACVRHHCLQQGVEASDLATVKDFFSLLYRYELSVAERDKLQDHPILGELQQNRRTLLLLVGEVWPWLGRFWYW